MNGRAEVVHGLGEPEGGVSGKRCYLTGFRELATERLQPRDIAGFRTFAAALVWAEAWISGRPAVTPG
jgi:hypothetical protein